MWGLFTLVDIPKGHLINEYAGIIRYAYPVGSSTDTDFDFKVYSIN